MTSPAPDHLAAVSAWERWYERVAAWAPYVSLAIGTAFSMLRDQPGAGRAGTLALVAVATAWTFGVFTSAGLAGHGPQWRVRLYYAGFLVLATLLFGRDPTFFVYVITGFFHAHLLRPWQLSALGIGATSLLVNSSIVAGEPSAQSWTIFLLVVAIQSAAIGLGLVGGEKISDLSEQRRVAVADLEAVLEENAHLHAQLVTQAREAGVLDERQRMAGEIHDTLAQGLTGVIMQLEAADQAQNDPPEHHRHIDNAARLARETLAEARRSVQAIQPAPLDDSRLPEALAGVAARWSELSGVPVNVATTGPVRPLHPDVEVALLRTAQEGLANVARHAAASRAGVTLSFMDDMVTLDVRDDGAGFVPGGNGAGPGGFGLTAMRQRVERLAGTLDIESEPGEGTAVSVTIPIGAGDG